MKFRWLEFFLCGFSVPNATAADNHFLGFRPNDRVEYFAGQYILMYFKHTWKLLLYCLKYYLSAFTAISPLIVQA